MLKVSLNKGIKPQFIFLPLLISGWGILGIFFARRLNMSAEKHVSSVYFQCIILSHLNFDRVRLYDVDSSCFPANRRSCRSSADLFLH